MFGTFTVAAGTPVQVSSIPFVRVTRLGIGNYKFQLIDSKDNPVGCVRWVWAEALRNNPNVVTIHGVIRALDAANGTCEVQFCRSETATGNNNLVAVEVTDGQLIMVDLEVLVSSGRV